jgi:uncharacterized coiled-coil DUF342 family protein
MHYLTTSEQERLAYAEGYTETAAVLARLDDAHHALGDEVALRVELEETKEKYFELIEERDELEERADNLSDELEDAQRSVNELGCKLHDTRAMLDLKQEKAKTYRLALMAIEAEVPAHIREFIREVLA